MIYPFLTKLVQYSMMSFENSTSSGSNSGSPPSTAGIPNTKGSSMAWRVPM